MTLSLPRLPLQLTASLGHDGLAVLDAVPAAPAPCPATGCGFVLCLSLLCLSLSPRLGGVCLLLFEPVGLTPQSELCSTFQPWARQRHDSLGACFVSGTGLGPP